MSQRRLEALRQLAERPGTDAEGILAREKLRRLEAKGVPLEQHTFYYQWRRVDIPTHWYCKCGDRLKVGMKCTNTIRHEFIRQQVKEKFPKGATVYYNYWAYYANQRGVVVGYPTPKSAHYETELWCWIRIKFDNLKQSRVVPIHSVKGWHLSTEPLGGERADYMRGVV